MSLKLTILSIRRFFHKIESIVERWFTDIHWINKVISFIPMPVKGKWSNLPKIFQDFLRNTSLALLITIFLHLFQAIPMVHEKEVKALDWVMAMNAGTEIGLGSSKDKVEHPYTFIDIDEKTYRDWDEPLFTPRDKILFLIKHAVNGGAKLIIVDIEMANANKDNPVNDESLKQYLSSLASIRNNQTKGIILVKSTRLAINENDIPEIRDSFLDEVVASSEIVHWASPMYDLDRDGVVRQWRILECASSRGGIEAFPSVQLLAHLLLAQDNKSHSNSKEAINNEMKKASLNCKVGKESQLDGSGNFLTFGNLSFSLGSDELNQRIMYSLNEEKRSPQIDIQGKKQQVFSYIPAITVIAGEKRLLTTDYLKGHIVIIGGSYNDSNDIYSTPIGKMPGAMIILNSVRTLLAYGTNHELPKWCKILIETFVIILLTIVFMYFRNIFAKFVAWFVIMLTLLPLSLYFFHSGIWINFATPFFAVGLFALIDKRINTKQTV